MMQSILNFALTGSDKSKINSDDYENYNDSLLKTELTKTSYINRK